MRRLVIFECCLVARHKPTVGFVARKQGLTSVPLGKVLFQSVPIAATESTKVTAIPEITKSIFNGKLTRMTSWSSSVPMTSVHVSFTKMTW